MPEPQNRQSQDQVNDTDDLDLQIEELEPRVALTNMPEGCGGGSTLCAGCDAGTFPH